MRSFSFIVERDPDTGLFVGHVPGWPGAHSQGESLDELQGNLLQRVVAMLLRTASPGWSRSSSKTGVHLLHLRPRQVCHRRRHLHRWNGLQGCSA